MHQKYKMIEREPCLCWNIRTLNVILQMRHQHQITSLKVAVVKRMMVDVRQDRLSTNAIGSVSGVNELTQTIHDG